MIEIVLQYVDDCPNWRLANERLREAVQGRDDVFVTYQRVVSDEDARRVGFRGSPTMLVDGADPFGPVDASGQLCCRLYPSPGGALSGAPTLDQMLAALPAAP